MNVSDLLEEELKTKDITIEDISEGVVPLNPTLAYLTLKRNALKSLKQETEDTVEKSLKTRANETISKVLIAKERTSASLGLNSGQGEKATVYKFTKEQLEILSKIQEKYGDDLIDEIITFRKNILAPYQIIKRTVAANKSITAKEKNGMTHSQFEAAEKSGLKKIHLRKDFLERNEDLQKSIDDLNITSDSLKQLIKDFDTTGKLKESIVNKVLKHYDLGGTDFDDGLADLKKTYSQLALNKEKINKTDDETEKQKLVKRQMNLRRGIVSKERKELRGSDRRQDLTNDEVFKKGINFNVALGKYMLRRDIIDELRGESSSIYKKTYKSILIKMLKSVNDNHETLTKKRAGTRQKIEFNNLERLIYKKAYSDSPDYSGNIKDYKILLKKEDFGATQYIKRPEKLIKAEKQIEAAIKRFERTLKTEIDTADYKELKKYRLINNLITVRELKTPSKLFKTKEEIKQENEE